MKNAILRTFLRIFTVCFTLIFADTFVATDVFSLNNAVAAECSSGQVEIDDTCYNGKFALKTTDASDTDTFQFKMSAAGTFTVDCGDGGNLTSTANDITNNNTITRNDTGLSTYTCTWSNAGPHVVMFISGTPSGHSSDPYSPTIRFIMDFGSDTNVAKIASIYGSLGAIFGTVTNPTVGQSQPNFRSTFRDASNMTGSIPENLFSGISGAPINGMFYQTFYGCRGLTGSIPENLFAGISGAPADWIFLQTFGGCGNLTGYIPPRLFAGISQSSTASEQMRDVFFGTNLATSCEQYDADTYTTGFESWFDGHVSCAPQTNTTVTMYQNTSANDDNTNGTVSVTFNSVMPSTDISAPTRPNYIFTGYYDRRTGGLKYYESDMTPTAQVWLYTNDNAPIYAQWAPDCSQYNGTIDDGNGSCECDTENDYYGDDYSNCTYCDPTTSTWDGSQCVSNEPECGEFEVDDGMGGCACDESQDYYGTAGNCTYCDSTTSSWDGEICVVDDPSDSCEYGYSDICGMCEDDCAIMGGEYYWSTDSCSCTTDEPDEPDEPDCSYYGATDDGAGSCECDNSNNYYGDDYTNCTFCDPDISYWDGYTCGCYYDGEYPSCCGSDEYWDGMECVYDGGGGEPDDPCMWDPWSPECTGCSEGYDDMCGMCYEDQTCPSGQVFSGCSCETIQTITLHKNGGDENIGPNYLYAVYYADEMGGSSSYDLYSDANATQYLYQWEYTSHNFENGKITIPQRDGYVFTGYYANPTSVELDENPDAQPHLIVEPDGWLHPVYYSYMEDAYLYTDLYAYWSPARTATLYQNAGVNDNINATVNVGNNATMPSVDVNGANLTPPTRSGYIFTGYYDARDGGTKYYNYDMTSANVWSTDDNGELYAQWLDMNSVDYKFTLTTTNLSANNSFSWKIKAAGDFIFDCGTGGTFGNTGNQVAMVTHSSTSSSTYTCNYTNAGVHTIQFAGNATGYDYWNTSISFNITSDEWGGVRAPNSDANATKIASISGSLGQIFGTVPNSSNPPCFAHTFAYATNLTTIPTDLFDGVTNWNEYTFPWTFYGCAGLNEFTDGTKTYSYIPASFLSDINGTSGYYFARDMFANTGLASTCPAGTYNVTRTYYQNAGKPWCASCQNGYTSPEGSTSENDCYAITCTGGSYWAMDAYTQEYTCVNSSCTDGYRWDNSTEQCVSRCPEGSQWYGGLYGCQSCPEGQEFNTDYQECRANCTGGSYWGYDSYTNEHTCVNDSCAADYRWDNTLEQCVYRCPDGQTWQGANGCVPSCPVGQEYDGAYGCHEICKGGSYWSWDGGMGTETCVNDSCAADHRWDNTNEQCVPRCSEGATWYGGGIGCVTCPEGYVYDDSYGCHEICTGGSYWTFYDNYMGHGACVNSSCTDQQYWDNSAEQCVSRCSDGQEWDEGIGGCRQTCQTGYEYDFGYGGCHESCKGSSYWDYDSYTGNETCVNDNCTDGYRWDNTLEQCVSRCLPNETWTGSQCISDEPSETCEFDGVYPDCCGPDQYYDEFDGCMNNEDPSDSCGPDEYWDGETCVWDGPDDPCEWDPWSAECTGCTDGYDDMCGSCYEDEHCDAMGENYFWHPWDCTCMTCGANAHFSDTYGECICDGAGSYDEGTCESQPDDCTVYTGSIENEENKCVCDTANNYYGDNYANCIYCDPSDHTWTGYECRETCKGASYWSYDSISHEYTCMNSSCSESLGMRWDNATETCVSRCGENEEWDNSRKTCRESCDEHSYWSSYYLRCVVQCYDFTGATSDNNYSCMCDESKHYYGEYTNCTHCDPETHIWNGSACVPNGCEYYEKYNTNTGACEPRCSNGVYGPTNPYLKDIIGTSEATDQGNLSHMGSNNNSWNYASHRYNIKEAGTFVVDYGDKGKVTGRAHCSTTEGIYLYDWDTGTTIEIATSDNIPEQYGREDAQYCWCQITEYTPNGGSKQSVTTPWIVADTYGENCGFSCSRGCSLILSSSENKSLDIRDKLYGAYTCSACPSNSHATESNTCVCDFGYTSDPNNGGCNAVCTDSYTYWNGEQCVTCRADQGYMWDTNTNTCEWRCQENEEWDSNNWSCHETCTGGSYWGYDGLDIACVNDSCTDQQRWDNTNEVCVSRCLEGQEWSSYTGECHETCKGGSYWGEDFCAWYTCKNNTCTNQQRWDNTTEQCVSRCPEGQEWDDGWCMCHETCTGNTYWDWGYYTCVETCTGGSYWNWDDYSNVYTCVNDNCEYGYKWDNTAGECVSRCPDGQTFDGYNGCHETCKDGSYWGYDNYTWTQTCVSDSCEYGYKWDNTAGECVSRCPDGQEFDDSMGGCIENCTGGSYWGYEDATWTYTCINNSCEYGYKWDNTAEQCVPRCTDGKEWSWCDSYGTYNCFNSCTGNTYWHGGYCTCVEDCKGGSSLEYDSTTGRYICVHPDCNAPYRWNNDAITCALPCPEGYYTPAGTTQCYPHILHVGDNVVYLKSEPSTTPSFNVKIGNDTFYANMTTTPTYMSSESPHYMNVKYNNTTYYVCDDTTYSGN